MTIKFSLSFVKKYDSRNFIIYILHIKINVTTQILVMMSNRGIAKCAECKRIIDKNYIKALGKKWHVEHFKCSKCSKVLSGQTFIEKNGLVYCKKDYLELFCHKCSKCKEYIVSEAVRAIDKLWHVDCFTCTSCQQSIKETNFFIKHGKPYCIRDYKEKFVPKCNGCGECIFEDQLRVLGGIWHCKCFLCKDCRKPMENKYFLIDMKPVCGSCISHYKKKAKRCYQSCCSLNNINGSD